MPLIVLLQGTIQETKDFSALVYYVISTLIALGLLAWRIIILIDRKVDKKTLEGWKKEVMTKEELEVFKENHDKEHASLTQRLEDWSKRQNEINKDLVARIEESAQNQKGINDKLVEKFDELIPKVTSIETKVDILVRDYESRIKLN